VIQRLRALTSTTRSRFFSAGAVGGLPAFILFAWFALAGQLDLFRTESLANFYEVQARAWLHGRWDAGPGDFLFERFNVNGKFFTYFGPAPSLLRLPVVLFTDSFDGRLSRVSMMLAFLVLLAGSTVLCWQGRVLLRGTGPATRSGMVATAAFVFLSGCGTTALFLAAKTWVYHEAILWGVALSVVSFSFFIAYLRDPRPRFLIWASATATLAFLSRGSVGIGPVFAIGVLFGSRFACWAWAKIRHGSQLRSLRLLGLGPAGDDQRWWATALALFVPIVSYAYVNLVKFGSLFGTPPYHLQDELAARVSRQAALAANHDSLFSLKYAPTTLWAYLRPDGIRFDRLFPWVSFAGPPRLIGNVVFEATNFSASITITSLIFTILVALGIWAAIRAPRTSDSVSTTKTSTSKPPELTAALFRVPILAAIFGCAGMLVLAFLEERYLGDFIPLLIVAGAVGLWWVARLLDRRAHWIRVSTVSLLTIIALWSVWSTASLTLLEQRAFGPLVSNQTRADFIDLQIKIHDLIPGGTPSGVLRGGRQLPDPAKAGSLYIVDDCDGLYWSNGRFWHPVEETPVTGRFFLHMPSFSGGPAPLMSSTDSRGTSIIWVEPLGDEQFRFVYEWTGASQGLIEGVTPDTELIGQRTSKVISIPSNGIDLDVQLDPAGYVGVRAGNSFILSTFAPVSTEPATVGVQIVSPTGYRDFPGIITVGRPPTPLCDELTDRVQR
jgi:hypothetical protein